MEETLTDNLGTQALHGQKQPPPLGPEPSAAATRIRGGTRRENPSSVAKGRPGSDALLTATGSHRLSQPSEQDRGGGGAGPGASSRRPLAQPAARGQLNGLVPGSGRCILALPRPADRYPNRIRPPAALWPRIPPGRSLRLKACEASRLPAEGRPLLGLWLCQ